MYKVKLNNGEIKYQTNSQVKKLVNDDNIDSMRKIKYIKIGLMKPDDTYSYTNKFIEVKAFDYKRLKVPMKVFQLYNDYTLSNIENIEFKESKTNWGEISKVRFFDDEGVEMIRQEHSIYPRYIEKDTAMCFNKGVFKLIFDNIE